AALIQRKAQIEGDLNLLQAKMAEAPGVAAEQGEIERQYQVLKNQYDQLLAQREQMKISSQAQNVADADKFNVVDPPTQPRAPSSP
ncbi:chain-length determining protein, partial [Escherichia coli]|nr:chain-length determining protein [Escherichia coli]